MILPGVAALVVLLVLLSGLRIAREYQRAVVFRLGRYTGLRGPGLFWLIPFGIENETRIDLRVDDRSYRAAGNHHPRQRDSEGERRALVSRQRPAEGRFKCGEFPCCCPAGRTHEPAKRYRPA